MIHFVFLITMSVLPESAFDEYSLIRGRRSAVSLADTFILENVLIGPISGKKNSNYLVGN